MSEPEPAEGEVVAVAWYRPSQWERLEEIAPDVKEIWQSYEQWRTSATRRMSQLQRAGQRTQKVEVDVEALAEWCRQRQRPVDVAARAEYAAFRLTEELGR
jgi:hypothetical protein